MDIYKIDFGQLSSVSLSAFLLFLLSFFDKSAYVCVCVCVCFKNVFFFLLCCGLGSSIIGIGYWCLVVVEQTCMCLCVCWCSCAQNNNKNGFYFIFMVHFSTNLENDVYRRFTSLFHFSHAVLAPPPPHTKHTLNYICELCWILLECACAYFFIFSVRRLAFLCWNPRNS